MSNQNDKTQVNELYDLMQQIKAQKENYESQIKHLDDDLKAVIKTINLLKLLKQRSTKSVAVPAAIDNSHLEGKTQREALVEIARRNNGTVKTAEAKDLLIKAGLITKTKNASTIVSTAINRSGRFERVSPGVYKLYRRPLKLLKAPQDKKDCKYSIHFP